MHLQFFVVFNLLHSQCYSSVWDQGVAWLSSRQRQEHIKCGWFYRSVHDNVQETMAEHKIVIVGKIILNFEMKSQ